MDYTEYDLEQWKGLHYRLPVDPNKTLADLIPSYAYLLEQRTKKDQFSTDEFLGRGEHALIGQGKGALSYYATTGAGGSRSLQKADGTLVAPKFQKIPASLNGQILTATIYGNGRLTLTGVRKEKDIHDAFLRLWHILRPFATSVTPQAPPAMPPYPREFLPGQRRLVKREQAMLVDRKPVVPANFPDVKPNIHTPAPTRLFVLPTPSAGDNARVIGTFAPVKSEGDAPSSSVAPTVTGDAPTVKAESTVIKPEPTVFGATGADTNSAIVIEGLPQHVDATAEDETEWE